MMKQRWALALIIGAPLGFGLASGWAQPPPSPATSLGLYAYPRKNQTEDRQLKDENKCYGSAQKQTGIDPRAVAAAPTAPAATSPEPQHGGAKGAAKGAAAGAAIGAISGSAGTGAAVGATAGAVHGRRQQKQTQEQAQRQAATQAQAAQAQQLDTFRRSFSACMDARGYSVK